VSIDYATEGLDYAEVTQQQRSVDASTKYAVAQYIINKSDCNNCHHLDTKSIGPMFVDIADKYKAKQAWAMDSLARKIRAGGGGVWGEVMMPAHPGISLTDAKTILNYILNSRDKTISTLPLTGSYVQQIPQGDNGKGTVIVRAAYTDKGAAGADKLTTEKVVILQSPHLAPNKADVLNKTEIKKELMMSVAIKAEPKNNGHMGYKHIDLTGIKQIGLNVSANPREGFTGGIIEIRTGSATGTIIGQATVDAVDPMAAMMSAAQAMQDKGGKTAPKKPQKKMTFDDYIAMMNRPGVMVTIKETAGVQDLYFVFKNPKAKPLEPIVSLKDIQFNQ